MDIQSNERMAHLNKAERENKLKHDKEMKDMDNKQELEINKFKLKTMEKEKEAKDAQKNMIRI